MRDQTINEYTLLCERCGYVLEGLASEGVCPECGKPIDESQPMTRRGSPWQQKPGVRSWFRTNLRILRRPRRTFDEVRVESKCATSLLQFNLVCASAAPAAVMIMASEALMRNAFGVVVLGDPVGGSITDYAEALLRVLAWIGLTAATTLCLLLLTTIEMLGIRFFGGRREWRITGTVALAICAHSSVGWVLGGLLVPLGAAAGTLVVQIPLRWSVGGFRGPMLLAPYWMPVAGFVIGLLVFETLTYVGMRRMKFANRAQPDAEPKRPEREQGLPSD